MKLLVLIIMQFLLLTQNNHHSQSAHVWIPWLCGPMTWEVAGWLWATCEQLKRQMTTFPQPANLALQPQIKQRKTDWLLHSHIFTTYNYRCWIPSPLLCNPPSPCHHHHNLYLPPFHFSLFSFMPCPCPSMFKRTQTRTRYFVSKHSPCSCSLYNLYIAHVVVKSAAPDSSEKINCYRLVVQVFWQGQQ